MMDMNCNQTLAGNNDNRQHSASLSFAVTIVQRATDNRVGNRREIKEIVP